MFLIKTMDNCSIAECIKTILNNILKYLNTIEREDSSVRIKILFVKNHVLKFMTDTEYVFK